jgi:hypothetical protein
MPQGTVCVYCDKPATHWASLGVVIEGTVDPDGERSEGKIDWDSIDQVDDYCDEHWEEYQRGE